MENRFNSLNQSILGLQLKINDLNKRIENLELKYSSQHRYQEQDSESKNNIVIDVQFSDIKKEKDPSPKALIKEKKKLELDNLDIKNYLNFQKISTIPNTKRNEKISDAKKPIKKYPSTKNIKYPLNKAVFFNIEDNKKLI